MTVYLVCPLSMSFTKFSLLLLEKSRVEVEGLKLTYINVSFMAGAWECSLYAYHSHAALNSLKPYYVS